MKVLIADDDLVSRGLIEGYLQDWGYAPVPVSHGREAVELLQTAEGPRIAILDWMMPYLSGPEVCQAVQKLRLPVPPYLILITSKADKKDVVCGLQAGAHDYVTKPYDTDELQARIHVAKKMVQLQTLLAERVRELEDSVRQVRQLRGLLPLCYRCKKVRNDEGYWSEVETYVSAHSEATFTHSLCPDCFTSALTAVREELSVAMRAEV